MKIKRERVKRERKLNAILLTTEFGKYSYQERGFGQEELEAEIEFWNRARIGWSLDRLRLGSATARIG